MKPTKVFGLTLIAMIAFASNSLLCRAALKQTTIDAATFTSVRIVAGAAALCLVMRIRRRPLRPAGNWMSAFALFAYAAAFSFAYVTLPAGTGALLLFVAVQATMIGSGMARGERLRLPQWSGLVTALTGLVLLLSPGLSRPPLAGSILMLGAGVAWGAYSLLGRKTGDAAGATAGNFLRALPMTILLSLALIGRMQPNRTGVGYAVISGAISSGVGYIIWYSALPALKATTAATVQLSAPVFAAIGGILFLGETLTWRFLISAIAVLGGIALFVFEKRAARLPN